MKAFLTTVLLAAAMGTTALAAPVSTIKCADEPAYTTLNSVYEMKSYSNGAVKVFAMDHIEPAAASYGIAVTVDRGEDLSTYESYCRYIPYLSSVSALSTVKSKFNASTNTLSLEVGVRQLDGEGDFVSKKLTITINKNARAEADIVQADVK